MLSLSPIACSKLQDSGERGSEKTRVRTVRFWHRPSLQHILGLSEAFNVQSKDWRISRMHWHETDVFSLCRKLVTETKLAKADEAIQKFEKNLLPHSPKRLEAKFLIGKADYYIRRATRKRIDITQHQRATDFQTGTLNIYFPVMDCKGKTVYSLE